MSKLVKPNLITYYTELIKDRFEKFIGRNGIFMTKFNREVCVKIAENFENISDIMSEFPLNFCHGDLKSPNIFYKGHTGSKSLQLGSVTPVFLDW